jgi:hypothetical protein
VGSDAMHVGTNGSHPYVRLLTNHPGLVGEGIVSRSPHSPNSNPPPPPASIKLINANPPANRPSATAAAASSSASPSTSSRGGSSPRP